MLFRSPQNPKTPLKITELIMEKKSTICAAISLLFVQKIVKATDEIEQRIVDVISSVVSDPSKLVVGDFE